MLLVVHHAKQIEVAKMITTSVGGIPARLSGLARVY
jgi:hypothetical protein